MSQQTREHNIEPVMVWWPYQQYVLTSRLSPQQIEDKFVATANQESDYKVSCADDIVYIRESSSFKIGAHSRSFRPKATLIGIADGTKFTYRVAIRPRTNVWLLFLFVVLPIIAGILFSKKNDLLIGHYKDPAIASVCVLLMGYFLPVITFNADLNRLRSFIDDLLDVEP